MRRPRSGVRQMQEPFTSLTCEAPPGLIASRRRSLSFGSRETCQTRIEPLTPTVLSLQCAR